MILTKKILDTEQFMKHTMNEKKFNDKQNQDFYCYVVDNFLDYFRNFISNVYLYGHLSILLDIVKFIVCNIDL